MGIQGLLPLFISRSWKAAALPSTRILGFIKELCAAALSSVNEFQLQGIHYCMHRVNLMMHYGVKPVMVFDGGLLSMKGDQENKRARSRKESLARAIEHEADGNLTAAFECYQKAVDISPAIACELIQVLKRENVRYVVAPYEADAQLTFLAITKQVEAVITEASDLIPFGCPRMGKFGQGVQFRSSMLQRNRDKVFSFIGCNLSHFGKYKSISGKSFHSLNSSFKFNSSSSRASGLRTPLKNIRNIYKSGPTAPVADISKFSCVPSKVKIVRKPRRG